MGNQAEISHNDSHHFAETHTPVFDKVIVG